MTCEHVLLDCRKTSRLRFRYASPQDAKKPGEQPRQVQPHLGIGGLGTTRQNREPRPQADLRLSESHIPERKGVDVQYAIAIFRSRNRPPANLLPRALLALQVAPAWVFASFVLTSSINQQKAKETPFSILLADNSRPTQDVK